MTGNEVSAVIGTDNASITQMRDDAREWGKANITGFHTNTRTNITVEIRAHGIKEAVSHGSGPDKLRALAAIPELIRNGVVVFDGKNPKNAEQRLVAIAAKVRIKGEDFVVTAGMREDSNGRLFYDHELMEIESAGRLSSEPGLTQGKNTAPPARLNDITRRFIVQTGDGVSKVVDANGEPLVVYHGTTSDFAEFNGHAFFTTSPDTAGTFAKVDGGNVRPVYLSLQNPARLDMLPPNTPSAIARRIRSLQNQGYDGAIVNYGVDGKPMYIAFYSTQIKSAIGNNGDFDATNPDIRFSRGPVAAARDTLAAARELNLAAGYQQRGKTCCRSYSEATASISSTMRIRSKMRRVGIPMILTPASRHWSKLK